VPASPVRVAICVSRLPMVILVYRPVIVSDAAFVTTRSEM
jgi:hypothetical protein